PPAVPIAQLLAAVEGIADPQALHDDDLADEGVPGHENETGDTKEGAEADDEARGDEGHQKGAEGREGEAEGLPQAPRPTDELLGNRVEGRRGADGLQDHGKDEHDDEAAEQGPDGGPTGLPPAAPSAGRSA